MRSSSDQSFAQVSVIGSDGSMHSRQISARETSIAIGMAAKTPAESTLPTQLFGIQGKMIGSFCVRGPSVHGINRKSGHCVTFIVVYMNDTGPAE